MKERITRIEKVWAIVIMVVVVLMAFYVLITLPFAVNYLGRIIRYTEEYGGEAAWIKFNYIDKVVGTEDDFVVSNIEKRVDINKELESKKEELMTFDNMIEEKYDCVSVKYSEESIQNGIFYIKRDKEVYGLSDNIKLIVCITDEKNNTIISNKYSFEVSDDWEMVTIPYANSLVSIHKLEMIEDQEIDIVQREWIIRTSDYLTNTKDIETDNLENVGGLTQSNVWIRWNEDMEIVKIAKILRDMYPDDKEFISNAAKFVNSWYEKEPETVLTKTVLHQVFNYEELFNEEHFKNRIGNQAEKAAALVIILRSQGIRSLWLSGVYNLEDDNNTQIPYVRVGYQEGNDLRVNLIEEFDIYTDVKFNVYTVK